MKNIRERKMLERKPRQYTRSAAEIRSAAAARRLAARGRRKTCRCRLSDEKISCTSALITFGFAALRQFLSTPPKACPDVGGSYPHKASARPRSP